MPAAIWIVRKTVTGKPTTPIINGIEMAIINADDAGNAATTIAEAEAALQGAGVPIPSGYFNTAALALASGQLDTDEDVIAVGAEIASAIA